MDRNSIEMDLRRASDAAMAAAMHALSELRQPDQDEGYILAQEEAERLRGELRALDVAAAVETAGHRFGVAQAGFASVIREAQSGNPGLYVATRVHQARIELDRARDAERAANVSRTHVRLLNELRIATAAVNLAGVRAKSTLGLSNPEDSAEYREACATASRARTALMDFEAGQLQGAVTGSP